MPLTQPLGDLDLTFISARHCIRTYQQRGNSQISAKPLGIPESFPEDHAPLRRDGHPHTSDDVLPGWCSVQHRLLGPQSGIETLQCGFTAELQSGPPDIISCSGRRPPPGARAVDASLLEARAQRRGIVLDPRPLQVLLSSDHMRPAGTPEHSCGPQIRQRVRDSAERDSRRRRDLPLRGAQQIRRAEQHEQHPQPRRTECSRWPFETGTRFMDGPPAVAPQGEPATFDPGLVPAVDALTPLRRSSYPSWRVT